MLDPLQPVTERGKTYATGPPGWLLGPSTRKITEWLQVLVLREKILSQGASCVVIDAYRFRIIRDSWQKTDKRDAANLSLALWLSSRSGEMKLPEVWQPGPVVRELRRLVGLYELLNK
jgi:hypothetical protein